MNDVETPIWRQAINDAEHPLHQATWILFRDKINLKFADRQLSDKKEEVIEFIYTILDTDELYDMAALGSGNAPINAVQLLGHWQVVEALPRLLRIIEEDDVFSIVRDRTFVALRNMGPQIIDAMLEFAEKTSDDVRQTVGSILADVSNGDERAFEYLKNLFDEQTEHHDLVFTAENLLACDMEAGIIFLEKNLKRKKLKKDARARIKSYIKQAREGTLFSWQP